MTASKRFTINLLALLKRGVGWLVILLIVFYIGFPIYWTAISSLKSPATLGSVTYWPERLFSINYQIVSSDPAFATGLHNSIIVSVAVVALTLVCGSAAAYALGRLRFRGRRITQYVILMMIAFPQISLIAGLYQLVTNPCVVYGGVCREHQLYNTLWALIISDLILTLPLTVWFLSAFFRDLPVELEEAAYVDGASPLQAFVRIILPIAAPGLVTIGLLAFITAWNEFLFALFFTYDGNAQTAPIVLANYGMIGMGAVLTLAGAMIITTPPALLAVVFQRKITTGLTGVAQNDEGTGWRGRVARRSGLPDADINGAAGVLLCVLALGVAIFAAHGWEALTFPYSLDYGEGPLLDQTLRLARFENIYRADLATPPFTIANYPPLYMLVQTPLAALFGPVFWYGRLLSLLSMLGAALFIGLTLHALTRDRLAALVGGATLLAIPYTSYWGALYRIDSLALCLSCAALWVVARWPHARRGVLAATLLLVAAIYTRQSYGLAAPFAAFVWLWRSRQRGHALLLAGVTAAISAALFALINALTGGGFFFNIVTANLNAFQINLLSGYLGELWTFAPLLVMVTGIFVLLGGAARVRAWNLLLPYAAGAALSGLTIGKIGSNVNYLLEFSAAMSLAVGATVAWQRRFPLIRSALMLGLALQLVLMLPGWRYQLYTQFRLDARDDIAYLVDVIHGARGPVLADEDMGQLVYDGRALALQPFEMTQLARAAKWDQRPLLDRIARREYALILIYHIPGFPLGRGRWTDEMLTAIAHDYTAVEQIGNTVVYRPNGTQ